jgi:hypothetical protein
MSIYCVLKGSRMNQKLSVFYLWLKIFALNEQKLQLYKKQYYDKYFSYTYQNNLSCFRIIELRYLTHFQLN